MSDLAKVKRARQAVEKAARKAGVPVADIRMALGGGRQAAKKPAKADDPQRHIALVVSDFLWKLEALGQVIDLADLQSDRVLRAWTGPRAVAMGVVRDVLGDRVTLRQIGDYFGRDHSTVVAALNRCKSGAFDKTPLVKAAKATIAHFRKAA